MLAFFATGAPGMSRAKPGAWDAGEVQAEIVETSPAWSVPFLMAGAWLGVHMRVATEATLGPVQRVFRIRQNWHLYGGGPRRINRLEVWVDGALRYRSADPDHQWASDQLDHRRFRPIVERVVERAGAANHGVVCELVRRRVEAETGSPPDEIRLWATRQRRDGSPQTLAHGAVCAAPDFALVHLDRDGAPVAP